MTTPPTPPVQGFEAILSSMLRMVRISWKAEFCLFMQLDDGGKLQVRASDGLKKHPKDQIIDPRWPEFSTCIDNNRVVSLFPKAEAQVRLKAMGIPYRKNVKHILAPVFGQSKSLGLIWTGSFPLKSRSLPTESQLRSTGTLCAAMAANWRLYEWLSQFTAQVNHELRTPLTAVQGSIGMVLGGVFGEVGDEVKDMLQMAQKGCERTVRAIEDYLIKQQNPK